mgnify:CR=1 FL=1
MYHGKEILDLAGKTAPYMTKKLKEIGNGSMAEGISAMIDYSVKYGMEIGEKVGLKRGFGLGVCTMGALWFATKIWEDFREYKTERMESLQVVEQQMKNADTKQLDEEPSSL